MFPFTEDRKHNINNIYLFHRPQRFLIDDSSLCYAVMLCAMQQLQCASVRSVLRRYIIEGDCVFKKAAANKVRLFSSQFIPHLYILQSQILPHLSVKECVKRGNSRHHISTPIPLPSPPHLLLGIIYERIAG